MVDRADAWMRRSAAAIIGTAALVLVIAAALVPSRPASAASALEEGRRLLEDARTRQDDVAFEAAEVALRRAVDLDPASDDARVALATVALSRHGFAEAIDLATSVLAVDATRVDALAIRGDAQLAVGDAASAAADHRRLHELAPGPESLVRLAHGLESSGAPALALDLVRRAVAELEAREIAAGVAPTGETAAWYRWRLGDLERHIGHWDRAIARFDEAARIQPGYALAYEGLVDVALKTGELDAAEELIAAWADLGPSSDLLDARATLQHLRGDPTGAARSQARRIALLETLDQRVGGFDLALALLDVGGRSDEALALTTAELDRRRDAGVLAGHAVALLESGQTREARIVIDEALATGTDEPGLLFDAARISLAEGADARAVDELAEALAVNPIFDPIDGPKAAVLLAELTAVAPGPA